MTVLGGDRCRAGWVGVAWGDTVRGAFGTTLTELVDSVGDDLAVIAVDIPIGLPDTGSRQADVLARRRLGRRAATLFLTPTRDAVVAPDRAAASRRNVARGGPGVTAQTFALVPAILDAEEFVLRRSDLTVVECHPECSFAEMNGGQAVATPKRTWQGMRDRLALLRGESLDLMAIDLGPAGGRAATDDVIDAAAAAWTARRCAAGRAERLPTEPERFAIGPPAAICI